MRSILLFLFFIEPAYSDTFRVALPMLPDINPITNQINSGNYIGAHLYYPLFKFLPDSEQASSQFLDMSSTKLVSKDYRKYQFCLIKNVKFLDDTKIQLQDFEKSLTAFSKMYPQILPVKKINLLANDCLTIKLKSPTPDLFRKLTGTASTIIKDGDATKNYPMGLGPYALLSKSNTEVILESRKHPKPRFDRIKLTLANIETINYSNFDDINQLPPNKNRDAQFVGNKIDAPIVKAYSFVINLKQKNKRLEIQRQLKKIDWLKTFDLSLIKSNDFLPWPSNQENDISSIEVVNKNPKNFVVDLLIPDFYDVTKVKQALEHAHVNHFFRIQYISSKKFAEWAFSGKEYVGLMGFDSSGSISSLEGDFAVYFESFFSSTSRIVTSPINLIKNLMEKASSPMLSGLARKEIMLKAEKHIISGGYVLPLGKVQRKFLYPSNIEIKTWNDFFSGIPQIDKIEI